MISTVAGSGSCCYGGDGGPATSALLEEPFGVAVDSSGNLYIGDSVNERVRKVSAAGVISTVAGNGLFGFSGDGGAATNASLNDPLGVAVDASRQPVHRRQREQSDPDGRHNRQHYDFCGQRAVLPVGGLRRRCRRSVPRHSDRSGQLTPPVICTLQTTTTTVSAKWTARGA